MLLKAFLFITLAALAAPHLHAQTLLSKPEFVITSDIVKPNIILTMDNSGSMGSGIPYDPTIKYPPLKSASGVPLPIPITANDAYYCGAYASNTANYDNCRSWLNFYHSRMQYAKTVTWNTFFDLEDKVRVGMFELYQTTPRLNLAPWNAAQKTNFHTQITALSAIGGTPLHEATGRVGNYLKTAPQTYASDSSNFTGDVSCRANYHILVTDGVWTGSTSRGNVDGTDGPLLTSTTGASYQYRANALTPVACTASSPAGCTHGVSRSDAFSNTLADEAMYWWKNDLRPDLPNHVRRKPSDANPAFWQNVTFYGVALDIAGKLNAVPAWPSPSWADPAPDYTVRVDDLRHAAHNTFGKFFSTANPAEYKAALEGILADIPTAELGSQSGSAISGRVVMGSGMVFEPSYRVGSWDGNLLAKTLNANGSIVANPVAWDAKAKLNALLNPANVPLPAAGEALHAARKIITHNPSSNAAVPFRHTFISADQQAALKGGAASTHSSADILNYLRGERTNEQRFGSATAPRPYRDRSGYLGAIVNSSPLVVREAWRSGFEKLPVIGTGYNAFIQTLNNRAATVWAGASDGMIHVFDAATGNELMAYVPGAVYGNDATSYRLFKLSQPGYEHEYTADGQFTESTWHDGSAWKALTIAGLGAGGRGWVGFDTTTVNYAALTETGLTSKVRWELNAMNAGAAATHLGYSFGQALTLPTGTSTGGVVSTQWVTVMGNGYGSPSGAAALVVVSPATGAVLHTVVLEPPSATAPNGLSTPRPVYDAQGRVKALYAGDLRGNVWKINLAGASPAAWTVSKLYAGSSTQPITTQPEVDYAPNGVNYQVLVGTGKLIHAGDKATTAQQYFLAVADTGQTTPTTAQNLATITLVRSSGAVNITQQDAANAYGYKLRLPQAGDRVLGGATVYRDVLYFTSFNPQSVASTTDPCADNATTSESVVYAIDPRTGGFPPNNNGYPVPAKVGAVVNAGLGGFVFVRSAAAIANPDGTQTLNPNAAGGSCFVLVNKLNGTSQTLPMKCPTPNPVRYWRSIPGGAAQ